MKEIRNSFLIFAGVFCLIMLANADVLGLQSLNTSRGKAIEIEAQSNGKATIILAEANAHAIESDADMRYMVAEETQTRENREQAFGFVHQPIEDVKDAAGFGFRAAVTVMIFSFLVFVVSVAFLLLKNALGAN